MDKKKHLGIIFDVENPFHNKVSHKPLYYTGLITNYPLNRASKMGDDSWNWWRARAINAVQYTRSRGKHSWQAYPTGCTGWFFGTFTWHLYLIAGIHVQFVKVTFFQVVLYFNLNLLQLTSKLVTDDTSLDTNRIEQVYIAGKASTRSCPERVQFQGSIHKMYLVKARYKSTSNVSQCTQVQFFFT